MINSFVKADVIRNTRIGINKTYYFINTLFNLKYISYLYVDLDTKICYLY